MTDAKTVPAMLRWRIEQTPDRTAWQHRIGGDWAKVSWREFGERVRALSCGLRAGGLRHGERVAILCSTRLEWIEADLAALCAGGAVSTIYPSSTAEECGFILSDSGATVCFVESVDQLQKIIQIWDALPDLREVVLIEGSSAHDRVVTFSELARRGQAADRDVPGAFDANLEQIGPDDLATLIYTSGTTGVPKGVMLTHDNWVATTASAEEVIRPSLTGEDAQYLFLPLSHSFGKICEMIAIRIGLPTAVDGDIPYLVTGLKEVRPTFCGAVPRVFEKVYAGIHRKAKERGPFATKLLAWASRIGERGVRAQQQGLPLNLLERLQLSIAQRLVFRKIRDGFGGRMRCFISGGAPLAPEIAIFFYAAGLPVLEGYGLTESSAGSVSNRLDDLRFGSVGKAYPGVELRIAPDEEVLLRGRGIMKGYYNRPEATAEALDEEGWLHTGDLGRIDEDGFLYITGRKKELIITAGGKNIAPSKIENKIKAACPYVSQVIVHGDKRRYCVALLTLDVEAVTLLASERGIDGTDAAAWSKEPLVRAEIQSAIDAVNKTLPSFETIKRFAILDYDLSVEGGELTPSLKVKRRVLEARHLELLDGLYEG
ncbi:MAG: long-chain fatty acid--CoA ligase [Deltaproteobacteria bacterium]|nr:MAG: long-chain fatty acid--CoA ligase [Deltaproteobacteria bacterium]